MEDFLNNLTSSPLLNLAVLVIIFVFASYFLIKRIFVFLLAIFLFFVVVVTGYAILNQDIVRGWVNKNQTEQVKEKTVPKEEDNNFKSSLINAYEQLKEKVNQYFQQSQNPEPEKKEVKPKNSK